jgi:hypothetical protein
MDILDEVHGVEKSRDGKSEFSGSIEKLCLILKEPQDHQEWGMSPLFLLDKKVVFLYAGLLTSQCYPCSPIILSIPRP